MYPALDFRDHVLTETCWCQPELNEDGVVVHKSMDKREDYEHGWRFRH